MTKKMTYVEAITKAIEGELTPEVIEKLEALKASVEKRNSRKSGKPTKTQRENEGVKADILKVMSDGKPYQCKTIAAALELSGQKISALLNQLAEAGAVEKFVEKRVTYFKVATSDEAEAED